MKFRDRHPRCAHPKLTPWLSSLLAIFLVAAMPAVGSFATPSETPDAEAAEEQEAEPPSETDEPVESPQPKEDSQPEADSEAAPEKKGEPKTKEETPAKENSDEQATETTDSESENSAARQSDDKQNMKQDEAPASADQASEETKSEAEEAKADTTETETKEAAATSVEPEPTMEIEPEQPANKQPEPPKDTPKETEKEKCIIGSTATLLEKQSGLKFKARIDTGAKSCSLHVEKIEIQDESTKEDVAERMTENIGKVITFVVKNGDGKTHILKRKIASYVIIKTSDKAEGKRRYKVPLTFLWKNMEKEVLVTLNNRKHMEYPLLIGRNFLRGDFLVDVELNSDD